MNIKAELIERERVAYINNDPKLAEFFDATLEYVLSLEKEVNEKDKKEEDVAELRAELAEALVQDCENGVKWLNEQAHEKFKREYPALYRVMSGRG